MMTFQPVAGPPDRDPSLGREYLPEHGMEAPTTDQAIMWCHGAKAALRYAADFTKKALSDGKSPEEVLRLLEDVTALPFTHTRYEHVFENAAILDRSTAGPVWLAWTIGPREVPAA